MLFNIDCQYNNPTITLKKKPGFQLETWFLTIFFVGATGCSPEQFPGGLGGDFGELGES